MLLKSLQKWATSFRKISAGKSIRRSDKQYKEVAAAAGLIGGTFLVQVILLVEIKTKKTKNSKTTQLDHDERTLIQSYTEGIRMYKTFKQRASFTNDRRPY